MRKFSGFILIFLLFCCSHKEQQNDMVFTSNVWKTSDKRIRGKMASDLEKSQLIIDKNPKDVEIFLGNPDIKDENHWIYLIKTNDYLFNYDYYFNIKFDKETGKVRSNYIGD